MDEENPPSPPRSRSRRPQRDLRRHQSFDLLGLRGTLFCPQDHRFWPAFSRSVLSRAARETIGVPLLGPAHDRLLLDYGFGFTDAVKRPTARASDLNPAEFINGVALLVEKLERYRPGVACFHGVTAYRGGSPRAGGSRNGGEPRAATFAHRRRPRLRRPEPKSG